LKDLTAGPFAFGSNNEGLALFFYDNLLKRFQILFNVCPFKTMARLIQTAIQFFPQNKGKKATEYMTPDGLVTLVKYRACFQNRLDLSKDLLHLPEFLVLEGHLLWR
jgi:hypothetical protein